MNTLITIWSQPKKTLEYVLENKSLSYGFFIYFLASLSFGLTIFQDTGLFTELSLFTIILISICITYGAMLLGWLLHAALYTWVGKLLGGIGEFRDLVRITPVGSIPLIAMLPYNLLIVLFYGNDLFKPVTEPFAITNISLELYYLTNLLMLALGIFGIVIMSEGIGMVHHFSSLRGFGTIMIIVAFFIVLAIIILSIFVGFLVTKF